MSIFQCERCGCAENTAAGVGMFYHSPSSFDWSYAPELEGKRLCSACGPRLLEWGKPTITEGKWHGLFPRVFLPFGLYETNAQGNLVHRETKNPKYTRHAIRRDKFPCTRPLPGRELLAWSETDEYLGTATAIESKDSGVAIWANGTLYDSNHVIYWSYANEPTTDTADS